MKNVKMALVASMTLLVLSCSDLEEAAEAVENVLSEKPESVDFIETAIEQADFDEVASNPDILAQDILQLSDEVVSSLSSGDIAPEVAVSLQLLEDTNYPPKGFEAPIHTRTCEKSGNDVEVNIERSRSSSKTREGTNIESERVFKFHTEVVRTWSNDSNDLVCNSAATALDFSAADFSSGVSMAVSFTRKKTQWMHIKNKVRNREVNRQHSFISEGEREVRWNRAVTDTEGSTVTLEREVTMDVSRKAEILTPKNIKIGFETSIITKDDAPLIQTIVRDVDTFQPVTRTINSGTVVSQRKGGYLQSVYSEVVFGAESRCMPTSGQIEGALYNDDDNLEKSYTISFSTGQAFIEFEDGEQFEFTPQGCEIAEAKDLQEST